MRICTLHMLCHHTHYVCHHHTFLTRAGYSVAVSVPVSVCLSLHHPALVPPAVARPMPDEVPAGLSLLAQPNTCSGSVSVVNEESAAVVPTVCVLVFVNVAF